MKPEPLLAAFAKIEWAEAKIDDLNTEVQAFFESRPYKVVSHLNSKRTEEFWKFHITECIPSRFSIEAGAIINNLRSPLDQVVAALAFQRTGSEASAAFPFGRTKNEFESALNKQEKLLPAGAGAIIRRAKPYPRGNILLYSLNHLDRRNKHRPALMPINARMVARVDDIKLWNGEILRVGSRRGQHMVFAVDSDTGARKFTQPVVEKRPTKKSDGFIHFECSGNDMEFLTTTPNSDFEINIQPALDIAFKEVKGLEREPVVAVLHQMRDLVERILLTFEKRFFT